MNKYIRIILVIGASVFLNGCLVVNEQKSPPPASPTGLAAPQEDTRSITQLRAENSELRGRLAKAEKDLHDWRAAVDGRKRQLKELERDSDRVKKERDAAKKAAKKADKD
jgi:hypothetical protein